MLEEKYEVLKNYIASLDSVACAFSSGVDSTLLLKVAHEVLGEKVIAVTAKSELFPEREFEESKEFCEKNHIKQIIVTHGINILKDNPKNRCYLCKKELFTKILETARENNLSNVIEGSNLDDLGDYRPGLKAIQELKIKSPLRYAGFSKSEVRELSKKLNLKTFDKPSFACLASRFVYGETITLEKLKMLEKSEQLLFDLGFKQLRVRIHNNIARIEILPEDFTKIIQEDIRKKIYNSLKSFGFDYVTLDLMGYRTGSMNEIL